MRSALHSRWTIVAVLALAGAFVALPATTALAGNPTDNIPPVITVPPNQTVDNDPGHPGAIVNYPPATATDANGANIVCVPPAGSFFPIGTTTVTCTATDPSGNSSSASFTVTVLATFPTTQPRNHHRDDDHSDKHDPERVTTPAPVAEAVESTPEFTG